MTKNARDLAVGDVILVSAEKTFTIEEIKPSQLSGLGAPIIVGQYSDGRKAEIDLSSGRHLADHLFTVL
jgi:hypothetical protein